MSNNPPEFILRPMPRAAVQVLAGLWLMSYTALVYAASLSQVVRSFDFESLGIAALVALIGGGTRTILTLASGTIIVLAAIREAIRDSVVAVIGGVVTYLLMMLATAVFPDNGVTTLGWVQLVMIAAAGYSKGRWRSIIGDFISDYITRQRVKLRGGEPIEPPSSVRAPLEGK